jgi:phosphonoacetate hydrolase
MTDLARQDRVVTANGRDYRWPRRPTVVVCIDGSEPGYIEAAIEKGLAPNFARLMTTGANLIALSAMPSFTNPNNISIITGRPPAIHGIAGNFFYDPDTGQEVMMNDARFLRTGTIMAAFHDAGATVAVVTAKDKLRTLLSKGLDVASGRAVAFSAEKADEATIDENGIEDLLATLDRPLPSVYSADLSAFVMAAGVHLARTWRPDLMYLSTTDYIQHKAAPGTPIADDFYAMLDRHVGALDAAGCTLVLTADHGMNAKHLSDGSPDVVYLQTLLDDWLGTGEARVILPITDPYVAHHGALGSFATAYLPDGADRAAIKARIEAVDGIELVLTRAEASERFELPGDRIGDLVVVSAREKVIGTSSDLHDLSGLDEPLRSHGGLSEQRVPMIANCKVELEPGHVLRNFDVFDVALNRVLLEG